MAKTTRQFKVIMIMAILATLTLVAGLQSAGAHKDGAYSHDASIGYTNKNWMAALPDDRRLSDLSIPGTHDTMSYQIVGALDCQLDENITLTQSMDLETQLDSGIRVLDIRGLHQNNRLQMHHGRCDLGTDFSDVMSTVNNWLAYNDTETILMHVKQEWEEGESGNTRSYVNTFDAYMDDFGSRVWSGTGANPELGDLRGKIVILEDFDDGENSRYSNLDWETFDFQNEWQMGCHNELYGKWQDVEGHLERAASRYYDFLYQHVIYVNFLSAAYSGEWGWSIFTVGSCVVDPYFVASGHKNPATDAQRKDTGEDDTNPPNYNTYPDFRRDCQDEVKIAGIVFQKAKCDIKYEGTNILTADYLSRQTSLQRVGIIMADFPGKELIEQVIRMNELKANEPPVANLTGPNGADPYITHEGWLEFDASGSVDPEGDKLQYRWDLDSDGQWETSWSSDDEKLSHFVGEDWSSTVTVGVFDNQGNADTRATYDTLDVVVTNEPPTITSFDASTMYYYRQGDTAVIRGTWSDYALGGPGQTYTGLAQWSDEGDTRELILNDDGTFNTSRELVDILGAGIVSEKLTVEIIIYDNSGAMGSAFSPEITVYRDPPTIDSISLPTEIWEGRTAVVTGTFSDPVKEACDTRTYYEGTALWNDGIWSDLVANLDGTFETSRTFADEWMFSGREDTSEATYTVTITIYDFCRNPGSQTSSPLIVKNVPPTIDSAQIDKRLLSEGDIVTFSGTFGDPALGSLFEVYTARALWSDGINTPVTVDREAGTFETKRQFGDTGATPEEFSVQLAVFDNDGGVSEIVTSPVVKVENAPPTVEKLAVPDRRFFEGQEAVVYGSFSDPSGPESSETYRGWAEWSDGTRTELTFNGRVFRATHVIADDNPTGTPFDDYTVDITIGDSDDGISEPQTSPAIRIRNVDPVSSIDSLTDESGAAVGEGIRNVLVHTTLFLEGSFTDAGALDTHTATVQWGDGRSNSGPTTGSVAVMHRYGAVGRYHIALGVVDDDTGAHTTEASIRVVEAAEALADLSAELSGSSGPTQAVAAVVSRSVESVDTQQYGEGRSAADLIAEAVARLTGRGGAVRLLDRGNLNAALVRMWQAMRALEGAESADATLVLTAQKNVLALSAKSTAMTAVLDAEAAAVTDEDRQKITEAYGLIAAGDDMRTDANFLDAVDMYRRAAQEVQDIHGKK